MASGSKRHDHSYNHLLSILEDRSMGEITSTAHPNNEDALILANSSSRCAAVSALESKNHQDTNRNGAAFSMGPAAHDRRKRAA